MTTAIVPFDSVNEEWRPVVGHDGYMVSDLGRVLSLKRATPLLLRGGRNTKGYRTVGLTTDRLRTRTVHQLVLEAFVGTRPEGREARHLNGDQLDNRAENLAWGTHSANTRDKVAHGTHPNAIKTHCPQGHAYDEANTVVRFRKVKKSWGPTLHRERHCLTCTLVRRRMAKVALPADEAARQLAEVTA